ncbi:Ti-type conjugative transfer relaxase TraA [Bosea vaviloviae]|uniref:Ti-type conjugative transfer relaxase TraA n=1 Tax=Bosea vaviloviae TaxID=1526658 RepID=UPI0006BABFBE|nr:Ti-type conjugative transfer relaxase TraA [Bosea vaviloviae]
MAIYHLSMKPISRGSGRSAVAAAAYRAGERLTNERDGVTHDFTRRGGVEHSEIVLPGGSDAEWAKDRATLWNAAEAAEGRKDARVAREFEIALPHELNAEERLEATRTFAQGLADRYGTAVDVAIHSPHGETDVRNHHAHLLMTVRAVGSEGFLDKTSIERENKWLLSQGLPTSSMQMREIRQSWEQVANERLAAAGLDVRIDHRSHQERGLEIEPTEHMGVFATQTERRGVEVSRTRLDGDAARRNADLIAEKPEQVLTLITGERSVFDRHDMARALHRSIDRPEAFQAAFAKVMASDALVELQAERVDQNGEITLARYSTKEMVALERGMADGAMRMSEARSHGVDGAHVEAALAVQDGAIRRGVAADTAGQVARGALSESDRDVAIDSAGLSGEQRRAVEHVTGGEQIAVVVGLAGAGKSTMLAAARDAWERQGYAVHGAALSGKAAEGLEEASGIGSRTLASWEHGWKAGRGELGPKDVMVIDEAGMVGSRQLARFVAEAERTGAKLVMVGDQEQLQAIGAGAPFRAIAERVGFAELQDIRRQREDWQREASGDFARHRTGEGLSAYAERGGVRFSETRDAARAAIVADYMADAAERPEGSRVAMAHRRVDVRALNADIRAARQEAGELARGEGEQGRLGREHVFETNHGKRSFAPGDRIVFLENNRELGVKNGMLGTVSSVEPDRITARLDGPARTLGGPRTVLLSTNSYAAFDHGYATTIHKTQGATVDRSFVMASGTMDRHLTYVSMTRHRDQATLYASRDEFKSGMEALAARLGRDGSKETTLDYAQGFAERRGIAERFGVKSEIEVERDGDGQAHQRDGGEKQRGDLARDSGAEGRAADRRGGDRGQAQGLGADREGADRADTGAETPAAKRSMFAGLKLGGGRVEPQGHDGGASERKGSESSPAVPASGSAAARVQLLAAVEGYAKAYQDAARMRAADLPVLEHQKLALRTAGVAMDKARPGSTQEMAAVLKHESLSQRAMAELSGPARAAQLVAGMDRERQRQVERDAAERGVEPSAGKPGRIDAAREPDAEKHVRERDKGMER